MRIGMVLLVLSFCAASVCAQKPQTPQKTVKKVTWKFLTHWADAKRAAAKEKKPIYIHFTTNSSKWCRKIETETYPDVAVGNALTDYVCVTLDCTPTLGELVPPELTVNLALMDRLGGGGYPFLAMVTADGLKLNTVTGFVSPGALLKELDAANAVYKEYKAFMAYAGNPKTDKKGYDFAQRSMKFYAKALDEEHAVSAARTVIELDPENAKGDHMLAKLTLLQFSTDTPDKTAGMMDEVCKLDPQNEKNAFEQAIFLQVLKELAEVQSAKGVLAVAVPHLESLLKLADRARGIEAKLKQPSRIYRIASRAWCLLNQFENSMEWAQRALSVSKSPQESQSIKSFIEEIKAAKDKFAAATSQPAQQ